MAKRGTTRRGTTKLTSETGSAFFGTDPMPGLLLAHVPEGATSVDRVRVPENGVVVGRGPACDWTVADDRLSKFHVRFTLEGGTVLVEDLRSTNGTFLRGEKMGRGARATGAGDVVRAGHCVFVICEDMTSLFSAHTEGARFGLIGKFHGPALMERLREAAIVGRHVLLTGESGAGKELAATSLAAFLGENELGNGQILAHNCARFTSEEEATATLFGVGARAFSGVQARPGLLEQAAGGVLFLDEAHVLPPRVQRSLLRFVEDGIFSRIGETDTRTIEVTLILGTNLNFEVAVDRDMLAFDLVARFQHVHVPSLAERRADVPEIFLHYMREAARINGLDKEMMTGSVRAEQLEAICLLDFEQRNVRELIHLAEAMVARTAQRNDEPRKVVGNLLAERYPNNPVVQRVARAHARKRKKKAALTTTSHYEKNRQVIIDAYNATGGNLSETERVLKAKGFSASRRWIAEFLRKWGVR